MQDRFKFRAHFPNKKGIMQSKPIHYIKSFAQINDVLVMFETIDGIKASCPKDEMLLMQCTGLKDSAGIKTLWTIEHKDFISSFGYHAYGLNRRFNTLINRTKILNTKAKIVGNVYENTELLEAEE
jgi:hypothetical protein